MHLTVDVKINIGDILVSQTGEKRSKAIRGVTGSEWSHVGIVVERDTVLDAVSNQEGRNDVDTVSVESFKSNCSKVVLYRRPEALNPKQVADLQKFAVEAKKLKYTKTHMLLSGGNLAVLLVLLLLFFSSAISMGIGQGDNLSSSNGIISFVLFLLILASSFACYYYLNKWSKRSTFLVKETEQFLSKSRFGKKIVKMKHGMFCSKLVVEAEQVLNSPLSKRLKYSSEVWPKHIVIEVEKLNWESIELPIAQSFKTVVLGKVTQ